MGDRQENFQCCQCYERECSAEGKSTVHQILGHFDAVSVRDNNSGIEKLIGKGPEYYLDQALI